jgi:broad specificity phosphatase PhoE
LLPFLFGPVAISIPPSIETHASMEIHFFRHGQAGTRDHYDQLSALGQDQARRLGAYLAERQEQFDAVVCGALTRQQETARIVQDVYRDDGLPFPPLQVDERWNEFDLDAVYHEIAPLLAADDAQFATEFAELRRAMAENRDGVHRKWTATDSAIVRAWVEERYAIRTESWRAFRKRVEAALSDLPSPARRVAVFTSATPIGISVGTALGLSAVDSILRLAGAQFNTNRTRLISQGGDFILSSFNETAHLTEPAFLTAR